ncbi:hypothetical protein [Adlercreutzia sp. ZJ176]
MRRAPYSEAETARFFEALIPEGTARLEFARMLHAEKGEKTHGHVGSNK